LSLDSLVLSYQEESTYSFIFKVHISFGSFLMLRKEQLTISFAACLPEKAGLVPMNIGILIKSKIPIYRGRKLVTPPTFFHTLSLFLTRLFQDQLYDLLNIPSFSLKGTDSVGI
jgi:hypothetical protein